MKIMVQRWQGETEGRDFGYIYSGEGDGGYFFTWHDTLQETLDSVEADTIDPPTFSREAAVRALRKEIKGDFRKDVIGWLPHRQGVYRAS